MFKPLFNLKVISALIIAFFVFSANPADAGDGKIKILVLGDSLVAGYNIPLDQAYPAVLEKKLGEKGYLVEVINYGVSGDTTAGGVTRLEWGMEQKPDFVLLELGANDMLRGVDVKVTHENMEELISQIRLQYDTPLLVLGMKSLPNFGNYYSKEYEKVFTELTQKYKVPLYPFFLDGVTGNSKLVLADGLHPNPEGVKVMVEKTLPYVEQLIKEKK